jgi:hypothetical protein
MQSQYCYTRRNPPFCALSYTWGNPLPDYSTYDPVVEDWESPSCAILCNGQVCSVRQNLYDALLQIHATRPSGYLWIDALCIYSHRTPTKHLGTLRLAPRFLRVSILRAKAAVKHGFLVFMKAHSGTTDQASIQILSRSPNGPILHH